MPNRSRLDSCQASKQAGRRLQACHSAEGHAELIGSCAVALSSWIRQFLTKNAVADGKISAANPPYSCKKQHGDREKRVVSVLRFSL